MIDLKDKQGNTVKPLSGDEIKALREGHEYKAAVNLIVAKWRKAIIAVAALLAAGGAIYGYVVAPLLKKFGMI